MEFKEEVDSSDEDPSDSCVSDSRSDDEIEVLESPPNNQSNNNNNEAAIINNDHQNTLVENFNATQSLPQRSHLSRKRVVTEAKKGKVCFFFKLIIIINYSSLLLLFRKESIITVRVKHHLS